jgi:antitoxin VapB
VTNNIEAPRLDKEEQLKKQGWEFMVQPWYEAATGLQDLLSGCRVGADGAMPGASNLASDLARLRSQLTEEEGERFRRLGRLCAGAMEDTISSIQPGQSEQEIAAELARFSEARGVQPVAIMVAADERIYAYRHPIPKENRLKHYALVILCGRKWGLVCSITRAVHFGRLPKELEQKMHAAAKVDSVFIHHTRPGQTLGSIFAHAQAAYAETGYAQEWQHHHQGGSAGYEPREFVAVPESLEPVLIGQAFAWNPTIQGAKCEDTILVNNSGSEVLTEISGWPMIQVSVGANTYWRPAIREIPI